MARYARRDVLFKKRLQNGSNLAVNCWKMGILLSSQIGVARSGYLIITRTRKVLFTIGENFIFSVIQVCNFDPLQLGLVRPGSMRSKDFFSAIRKNLLSTHFKQFQLMRVAVLKERRLKSMEMGKTFGLLRCLSWSGSTSKSFWWHKFISPLGQKMFLVMLKYMTETRSSLENGF